MELKNVTIRPAKVVSVMDNNIIKVTAPGIFSKTDDPDLLPPVYPFLESSSNSFSALNINDEVWLLSVEDNPLELFWIRKPDYEFGLDGRPEGVNVEILMRKQSGAGWCEMYFEDGSGLILKNDSSSIRMDKSGDIIISAGGKHNNITLNREGVTIGVGSQPAVLGNELVELFDLLIITLEEISTMAALSPYTTPISVPINKMISVLQNKMDCICSKYVTLD